MDIFEGKNEFLFLGNRSDVIDSLSGQKITINHDNIIFWQKKSKLWKEYFEKNNSKFLLLVAPDKQSIYPEFVDDNIIFSRNRYIDILIENSKCNILYPLDMLYRYKYEYELYQTADTHWNDIGAAIVFNELAKLMNINKQINFNHDLCSILYGKGDLCTDNFQKRINRNILIKDFKNNSKKIFDSGLSFAGNIQLYENEDKSLPTALIFCDSFINTKLHFLSYFFSRLIKVSVNHLGSIFDSGGNPDSFLSQHYDFVLYELVERDTKLLFKTPNFISHMDYLCKSIEKNRYSHSNIISFSKSLLQNECPYTLYEINIIKMSISIYQRNFLISYIQDSKELEKEFIRFNFYKTYNSCNKIGAIVANCNPFHLGHRYLIETASSKCDLVYVFVLQEDKSFFSFLDRFIMVVKGCNDLNNVIPIPSGNLVISSSTFPDYFGKETNQEVVIDASLDVEIFAKFIAPHMGITIRFAGTEPFCQITKQYNKQLSEILKQNNIDFYEIDRCKSGSTVVSATNIRELFKKDEMLRLRNLVPDTTFSYLQQIKIKNKYRNLYTLCQDESIFIRKLYEIASINGDIESMNNFFGYLLKLHPNLFPGNVFSTNSPCLLQQSRNIMDTYSKTREGLAYYKYIRNFLSILSDEQKTIIDIGYHDIDVISHTLCRKKVSLDIIKPLQTDGVIGIKQDFFDFDPVEEFDIVCCFQCLEHIADTDVERFAQKLLSTGKIIVISVPFNWPKGICKEHIQDPVDAEKVIRWFKKEPLFLQVVTGRLFAIFSKNNTEELLLGINKCNFSEVFAYYSDGDASIIKEKKDSDTSLFIDEYKKVVAQNNSELQRYSIFTFEELLSSALRKSDKSEDFFKAGIKLYPFNKDKFGHPSFLKEYIRFLLDAKRFDDAEKIIQEKSYPSFKISNEQWWKILFARAYEKHNMLDKALEIFSSLERNNVEAKNAVQRIREKYALFVNTP